MNGRRLSVTADKRLERAMRNKRLSCGIDSEQHLKMLHVKKMFQQFFIIGAPPTFTFQPHATMLVSYPTQTMHSRQEEEINLITSFCFPMGLPKLPRSMNKNRTILHEYMFTLNEGTSKIYGVCILFKASPKSFFVSEKSVNFPFCICFLTPTPFLTSHFQFLSFLTMVLCYKIRPSPHTLGNEVVPSCVQAFLPPGLVKDEQYPSIAVFSGFKATKMLNDELDFYYNLPTTMDSAKLRQGQKYPIIQLSSKVVLGLPIHFSENENMAHASFHVLFSVFTIPQIIKIYTAILLEEHIIFVSKNLHRLSLGVMAIVSLLEPFEAVATMVIPMLPMESRFLGFLDSPCPYVVGVIAPYKDFELMANLDTGTITQKSAAPNLPYAARLEQNIAAVFDRYRPAITVPPRFIENGGGADPMNKIKNPDHLRFFTETDPYVFPYLYTCITESKYILPSEACDEILSVFHSHFPALLDNSIKECFVTDTTDALQPITVFNKDLYLFCVSEEEAKFYKIFFQTQIWEEYCDTISNAFADEKKKTMSVGYNNSPMRMPLEKMFGSMIGSHNSRSNRPMPAKSLH